MSRAEPLGSSEARSRLLELINSFAALWDDIKGPSIPSSTGHTLLPAIGIFLSLTQSF